MPGSAVDIGPTPGVTGSENMLVPGGGGGAYRPSQEELKLMALKNRFLASPNGVAQMDALLRGQDPQDHAAILTAALGQRLGGFDALAGRPGESLR